MCHLYIIELIHSKEKLQKLEQQLLQQDQKLLEKKCELHTLGGHSDSDSGRTKSESSHLTGYSSSD